MNLSVELKENSKKNNKEKKNHDEIRKDEMVTEIVGREPCYTLRFRSC